MSGVIDTGAEIVRLQKEIDKFNKELDKINIKLSNTNYVQNAPSNLVEQDQKRVMELQTAIDKLKVRRQELVRDEDKSPDQQP